MNDHDARHIQEMVANLLVGCAPEREDESRRICGEFALTFAALADKPGFELEAGAFSSVVFTPRTLHLVWMLGFAAWRAFQAYGWLFEVLAMTGEQFEADILDGLPGQGIAEQAFEKAVQYARALKDSPRQEDFEWPPDVPFPEEQPFPSAEESVARDILCLAGGFVFLHEIHHVMRVVPQPIVTPQEEELACDSFAADFLLERAGAFAATAGTEIERVLSLRAMGIMVGLFVILEITPLSRWGESSSHPAVRERVSSFLGRVWLSATNFFWSFAGALLLSKLRLENRGPRQLDGASPKAFCLGLVELL